MYTIYRVRTSSVRKDKFANLFFSFSLFLQASPCALLFIAFLFFFFFNRSIDTSQVKWMVNVRQWTTENRKEFTNERFSTFEISNNFVMNTFLPLSVARLFCFERNIIFSYLCIFFLFFFFFFLSRFFHCSSKPQKGDRDP